jgi:hypothetical protein
VGRNQNKNFMKKVKRVLMVLMAVIATGFLVTGTTEKAFAGSSAEDTWNERIGDCDGAPTDCLDTWIIQDN